VAAGCGGGVAARCGGGVAARCGGGGAARCGIFCFAFVGKKAVLVSMCTRVVPGQLSDMSM